jgi:glucokinase
MVTNPQVAFLNSKVLLIDIGGTNIRTASAQVGSSELLNANKRNLNCLDSFEEMLQGFLDQDASLKHVVFSIAGPKLNNSISMTNREFKIDESEILKNFEIDSCHILNDWESIGHGLSLFKKNEMHSINAGNPFNNSALILGPGTGLGAAQVINNDIVLPTEIGNSLLAIPGLLDELGVTQDKDFLVIEDIISGGGLAKIYSYFATHKKSPEEIVKTYHSDEFAKKSIELFLKALSQILSELALAYMPGQGIYLAGGLVRSLDEFLNPETFMKDFLVNKKSMHKDVLAQMPISLIQKEMTCLHGSLNFINKFSQNTY